MMKPKILVNFDGKARSLREWAQEVGVSYDTVLRRWHTGVRTEDGLLAGLGYVKRPITNADMEFLQETRYARAGQADEWQIACDLIGVPRCRAAELREVMGS